MASLTLAASAVGGLLFGVVVTTPLRNELQSVVGSVLSGTAPVSTAEDSIYALKVCHAALQSIEQGHSVRVAG